MLADVDAGSDTPSLVGKVLKWRTNQAQEGSSICQSGAHCVFTIIIVSKTTMGHLGSVQQRLCDSTL